jgi:Carboxypeptidase regulatory-like domain/TonB dependent receptor/TonB-dependent Receptor Plug Domain
MLVGLLSRLRDLRCCIPALLIASLLLPCVFAQETTAGLQGTVRDATGASIPNATVEVSSPALIGTRKVQTDNGGNYRIAAVPPGDYTLTVSAKGFRTAKQGGIDLSVGRLPTIDIKLEIGTVTETVEVASVGAVIDTTQSKVATTVEHEQLDNLPKGRSFQSLIPFAPGARLEPLQSGTATPGSALGFQIDGASDGENVYMIDGVNITNIQNGGVGKDFQMDFIEEVQVKTSSFEAEFGGALGGVINVVPRRGSNDWHGGLEAYLRSNAFNANNGDRQLRINPATSTNTTTRLDGTPEYYMANKDQRTILEPGYQVGGPLWKNKLWLFSSYVPSIDTTRRVTNFYGANPGPRTLTQTQTNHNAYNRLDYGVLNSLRVFGSWNYGYFRQTGALGGADSPAGQRNTGTGGGTSAASDPNTIRSDAGSVNPLSIFTFGGDWTPTAKLVVSARYGYFFNNTEQRGTPIGTRYSYASALLATATDLSGATVPSAFVNSSGYANIPSNLATSFDSYKRKSWNVDASYFAHFGGTHTFKFGYFRADQSDEVLKNFQGGAVSITWGQSYAPVTSGTACDGIIAQNLSLYGKGVCQGKYGYFTVGTGVINTGSDQQSAQALYLQDQWTIGRHLTLNVGVRFDQETQPPFDPNRFPTVKFGWGDKIAPRLGFAYDLLHNGKVKVYASYGQFYDIMKLGLARGSFGSDYWHNCVYAMDDADYTKITPTLNFGGGCPASGPAPGVTVGRFIENVDYRATKADPRDPAISPSMKPMKQHEFVTGADWAVSNNWSLTFRYSRKRLDNTIEDMSITDNLGFYIGNPGSQFADVLHRPTSIPCTTTPGFSCTPDAAGNYLNTTPFCAECPPVVAASRRYDGAEFRLAKRSTGRWFGSVAYTYSKLRGNYPGLTNTDPTDGTFGRHAPNNSRLFDLPTMTYLPNGKIDDGPLSTDRPHTATVLGYYRLPWKDKRMETSFGVTQYFFQGTPISSCLPVVGSSSACQWAEGRGNFVQLTRDPSGNIVAGNVIHNARTDNLIQTDFNLRHEIAVKENQRLAFEANFINLFNQRASVADYQFMIPTNLVNPLRPARFAGDPGTDWGKVMNGYNYIDALNGTGAFAGTLPGTSTKIQAPLTLASRYGMPNLFQIARNLRLQIRFTF